jgi:hypothetical protein
VPKGLIRIYGQGLALHHSAEKLNYIHFNPVKRGLITRKIKTRVGQAEETAFRRSFQNPDTWGYIVLM